MLVQNLFVVQLLAASKTLYIKDMAFSVLSLFLIGCLCNVHPCGTGNLLVLLK